MEKGFLRPGRQAATGERMPQPTQSCPLVRKLENFAPLSADERMALTAVSNRNIHQFEMRSEIRSEGASSETALLIRGGWACRYKYLEDGRRQIVALLLPGDLTDRHAFIFRRSEHTIAALTKASVAEVAEEDIADLRLRFRRVALALDWSDLLELAIQREWTVNLGSRDAVERVAHFLCEVFVRLQSVGMVESDRCALPLTQQEIGEIAGITAVHVNRVLQELRSTRLIALENRMLVLNDLEALMALCQFDPAYLHLGEEGAHLRANI
jgi:CRP-like cAMP-binding protein